MIACTESTAPQIDATTMKNIDWQGHRGARGLVPENTIPAFLKALEYDVTTLELDVAVSKDQFIIVSHEPYFSASISTKPDGTPVVEEEEKELRIYEMSYEDIKQYDVGSRGNERFPEQVKQKVYKPSLTDMVAAVKDYCTKNNKDLPWFNIEIKSRPEYDGVFTPAPPEFAQLLIDKLKELGIDQNSNIQSFDKRSLQAVKAIDNTFMTALLIENMDGIDANLEELGYMPEIYSPYYMMVTENVVKSVHEKGMKLIPWTINDTAVMRRMIGLGVDGIITDYPNFIQEIKQQIIKQS